MDQTEMLHDTADRTSIDRAEDDAGMIIPGGVQGKQIGIVGD